MKITYKGEYALRALLDLSYKYSSKEIVPITDICKRQKIPEKYLEHIMLILKKSGYVDSKRGIGGGFFLKKAPKDITLGEIIRRVDGPIEPNAGIANAGSDLRITNEDQKVFDEVWLDVTNAILKVVDHVTFADVMRRADVLRQESKNFNYII